MLWRGNGDQKSALLMSITMGMLNSPDDSSITYKFSFNEAGSELQSGTL